jgi:hypothetical protein
MLHHIVDIQTKRIIDMVQKEKNIILTINTAAKDVLAKK